MTFYDDLVNVAVRVMRGNVTTSNICPVCGRYVHIHDTLWISCAINYGGKLYLTLNNVV